VDIWQVKIGRIGGLSTPSGGTAQHLCIVLCVFIVPACLGGRYEPCEACAPMVKCALLVMGWPITKEAGGVVLYHNGRQEAGKRECRRTGEADPGGH
jgi:hypothetical protein